MRLITVPILLGTLMAFSQLVSTKETRKLGRCDLREGFIFTPHCCSGYQANWSPNSRDWGFYDLEDLEKVNKNLKCEPICDEKCNKFGKCIAPNKCDCGLNTGGPNCEKECPPLTFGPNCEFKCSYILDQVYNANYTSCWCQQEDEYLSEDCQKTCKCQRFLCPHGYFGKNCDLHCKQGTCGLYCQENCTCVSENANGCSPESCDCICKEGYYGAKCEQHCDGILKCRNNSTIHCTCELTPEQVKGLKELEKMKGKIEEVIKSRACLLFALVSVLVLLLIMCYYIYRIRSTNKRIKMNPDFVGSYANHRDERTTQFYQGGTQLNQESDGSTSSKSFKAAPKLASGLELRVSDENVYSTMKI